MTSKITIIALAAFLALTAAAGKPGYKQYTGQYNLTTDTGSSFVVILTRDGWSTILGGQEKDPIAGKVKFWKGKQRVQLLYPMYTFDGFANSLDNISGSWDDFLNQQFFGNAVMTRISDSNAVFHIKFMKSGHRFVKGCVFYNFGKIIKPKDYKIALYSVAEGAREMTLRKVKNLSKLGFFNQKFPRFQQVDVYIVPKDKTLELPVSYPFGSPLTVDGEKIMSYNYCLPEYKQPRDIYK